MRLEVKEGQHSCTLINDSYNSDINSLDIALDFMSRRVNDERRRTLILSDIFQSGKADQELYHEVNALCMERNVGRLIGIGPRISANADVFSLPSSIFFATTDDFLTEPPRARSSPISTPWMWICTCELPPSCTSNA